MRDRGSKVLIAGAGLGGLAAGLASLRMGVDVEIYEQAPELKEVGAGVQISKRLKPDAIRLKHRCTGFEQDAAGVALRFEGLPDARGAVLIGADGVHSVIRQQGSERDPQSALLRYESARRQRATQTVTKSAEMTGKFHNEALANAAGAEAYINAEWHPDRIRARYDWICQYDAARVAL